MVEEMLIKAHPENTTWLEIFLTVHDTVRGGPNLWRVPRKIHTRPLHVGSMLLEIWFLIEIKT
jgi:hypothetical protein